MKYLKKFNESQSSIKIEKIPYREGKKIVEYTKRIPFTDLDMKVIDIIKENEDEENLFVNDKNFDRNEIKMDGKFSLSPEMWKTVNGAKKPNRAIHTCYEIYKFDKFFIKEEYSMSNRFGFGYEGCLTKYFKYETDELLNIFKNWNNNE